MSAPDPRRPTPNELLGRLVDLAREASDDELDARDQAGLHALEAALLRRPERPARRWLWLLAPAMAAVVAAALVFALREREVTFTVDSGRVSDGGYVSSGAGAARVRFSDRSDLALEPGTSLRISDREVRGARVLLERGTLHAHIHTQPRGHWTLDAGPYIVHVTGTEFDLAWRVDAQTLDLRLIRGSVKVEGPLAGAGLQVSTGQHLIADANAGTLSLEESADGSRIAGTGARDPEAGEAATHPPGRSGDDGVVPAGPVVDDAAATSAPASAPAPAPAPPPTPTPAPLSSRASGGATFRVRDAPNWTARVAHGDFEGVLADAERRGLDRSLAEVSRADLAALADAARYARQEETAVRALSAERRRFPRSVQARDASFFLGGLSEAQKNDAAALEWYAIYLRETPNGAYASEALGHQMMIRQRLHGNADARPVALEYLARFPEGPYAPQARTLSEGR